MLKNFAEPVIEGLLTPPILFSRFLDEIPAGVILLDKHCRVAYLNRAFEALTGFSRKDSLGVLCRNILRGNICINRCPVNEVAKKLQPVSLEGDIINRERRLIPVRMTLAPLMDNKGKLSGYIETIEDFRIIKELDVRKSQAYSFMNIIGKSPQMEKVFQILPVLAQSDTSILITGETGTGKDLVAEAVHRISQRSKGAFIKINCGALPESLLESELFGHKKGAFTGAYEDKPGRFRLAHNGTLFLTEIGDLPLSLQVKLLTFLDDKVIYPLGSTKGFQVNVRMVAATHRKLEQMVEKGRFRKDLLYRLNVARVHLPPLREREADIRLLLDYFLNLFKNQLNKSIYRFSKDALAILLNYNYSGNVRELRNIVEYAVNITQNPQIETESLPAYLHEQGSVLKRDPCENILQYEVNDIPETYKKQPSKTWADAEREMILEALVKTKGKKTRAAKLLGWGRSTLWRKIKLYELKV